MTYSHLKNMFKHYADKVFPASHEKYVILLREEKKKRRIYISKRM